MWCLLMNEFPHEILFSVIGLLSLVVVTLGGLWVKSHDNHRQWATEKINEHEKVIAAMKATGESIREDISEIKETLRGLMQLQSELQQSLVSRIGKL